MDLTTAGGLALGAGLLLLSIAIAPGSSFTAFIDIPSFAVVVGGAVSATCIAFPLKTLLLFPKVVLKVFFPKPADLMPVITQMVELAEVARRDGILALESKADEITDDFILTGVRMAVDGTEPDIIEAVLRNDQSALVGRHKTGKGLMDAVGRYAPAFGMIGTLMGLIIMLGNMDDPEAIGPGMAVALITTLYGAIVSNLFFLPFADKLAFYSRKEMEIREVVVRGILAIQEGDNPRVLEQKLMTYIPPAQRPQA